MRVRRLVELDVDALEWALAVVKDNRFDVEKRNQMSDGWAKRYDAAKSHLEALIKKAKK